MENKHNNINQLLIACKTGDRVAQMTVYNQYAKAMYNTAYRIVNDKHEAEDVMQEAFLSAFTKLESFYGDSSFGAWLKRIVINNSISHLRKRIHFIPLSDDRNDFSDEIYQNSTIIEYKINEVKTAISELKENYRIPLSLKLIEGYDYEEISDIIGLSNQNCRTIISRAKAKLRSKLIQG